MKTEISQSISFSDDDKTFVKMMFDSKDVEFFNPTFGLMSKDRMGFSFNNKNRQDVINYLIRLADELKAIGEISDNAR